MTYQSIIFDKRIHDKDNIKEYMNRNIYQKYDAVIETKSSLRFRFKTRDNKNCKYKCVPIENGICAILEEPNTKEYAFDEDN